MVKLTASQKKKLKLHAVDKTARHMKTMIALMKAGESFNDAHKEASKQSQKQKQKQKQKQSQKIVINLASPNRQTTKPRANATPQSARVLSQFVQPAQVLPDFRTMINPAPIPMPFMSPIRSATATSSVATQTTPVPATSSMATQTTPITEGRILGRGDPLETPLEVRNVLKAIKDTDMLLSGKKEPDNRATEGRELFNYATDYDPNSNLDVYDQVKAVQLKRRETAQAEAKAEAEAQAEAKAEAEAQTSRDNFTNILQRQAGDGMYQSPIQRQMARRMLEAQEPNYSFY